MLLFSHFSTSNFASIVCDNVLYNDTMNLSEEEISGENENISKFLFNITWSTFLLIRYESRIKILG